MDNKELQKTFQLRKRPSLLPYSFVFPNFCLKFAHDLKTMKTLKTNIVVPSNLALVLHDAVCQFVCV